MLCSGQQLKCIQHHPVEFLCCEQKCYYQSCICCDSKCKCNDNHASCKKIKLSQIISQINQKRINTDVIKEDVQNLFSDAFNFLFDVRKKILEELQYFGLNNAQKALMQKVQKSSSSEIHSSLIYDICDNINQSYMCRLQQELKDNLYSWHMQYSYKRCFQKLKQSFKPPNIIHQTKSQMISQGSQKINDIWECNKSFCQSQQYFSQQQTKIAQNCMKQTCKQEEDLIKFLRSGYRCINQQKKNRRHNCK